jgi:AAA+ superfamily predicted ATPase
LTIQKEVVNKCLAKVKSAFKNPNQPILKFSKESKHHANEHVFALNRTIHIYRSLKRMKSLEKRLDVDLTTVQLNLTNRINQQISHSLVSPNLFDTSELVMSLEGLLQLEQGAERVNTDLVKKIFEIIKTHQDNTLYWRPLKPFVTTSQGLTLLPLSIEIGNSLLRICKLLQAKEKYFFFNYFGMFKRYFDWLESEINYIKHDGKVFQGWPSENVSDKRIVHPWETAQVIIFLQNYKALLQDLISYQTLQKSRLTDRRIHRKSANNALSSEANRDIELENFKKREPISLQSGEELPAYETICKDFVESRKQTGQDKLFSLLLYGPPGTGKSDIAETIAFALGWNLITITPSDFLQSGQSDIESNAKLIFRVLEEQENRVILFDEIDRLLLNRDSKQYNGQDEVFKFMTPSMLVKIKDLREKEKCIFIIATNYAELIDPAIKRVGRIDSKQLINAPDQKQRLRIINELLKQKSASFKGKISEKDIISPLQNMCLYTFNEIKQVVKKGLRVAKNDADFVKFLNSERLSPSAVSLTSYDQRFVNEHGAIPVAQCPVEEYLMLVFLKLESQKLSDSDVQNVRENFQKIKVSLTTESLSQYIHSAEIVKVLSEKLSQVS